MHVDAEQERMSEARNRENRAQDEARAADEPAPRLGRDLLTPYILLLLSHYQMHGYRLLQRLTEMGLGMFDPPTLYRTLRAMERDGLIASQWDTASEGPARRVYSLTEAGAAMLRSWAGALNGYQRTLNAFFDMYADLGKTTLRAFGTTDDRQGQGTQNDQTKEDRDE
jgi:PadR family transcriptional regulator, regulatory protein PadR